jgi:hypothetical protein
LLGLKPVLHGISLLEHDSDTNRRLAMLSIDNSVELMLKTFLGLPQRVTGIRLGRKELEEIGESFPRLLDAVWVAGVRPGCASSRTLPNRLREFALPVPRWELHFAKGLRGIFCP